MDRFAFSFFFALSAFVLAESTAKTRRNLTTLLVCRYLRLTVPMLTSLVLAWCLLWFFEPARNAFAAQRPLGWFDVVCASGPFPNFASAVWQALYRIYATGHAPLNNVLWTMRRELIGSVVIYVVYKLLKSGPRVIVLSGLGLLCLATPTYLCFPAGALLHEWHAARRRHALHWTWLAFVAAVALVALLVPWLDQIPDHALRGFPLANDVRAIAALLLIYATLTAPFLQRLLDQPVCLFLGKISFFLYLVHVTLLQSLVVWMALHISLSAPLLLLLLFVVLAGLSLLLAWILTLLIDQPLMRLLRRIRIEPLRFRWRAPSTT